MHTNDTDMCMLTVKLPEDLLVVIAECLSGADALVLAAVGTRAAWTASMSTESPDAFLMVSA